MVAARSLKEQTPSGVRAAVVMAALIASGTARAGGLPQPFTEVAVSRGLSYVMQNHIGSYGWFGFGTGFADLDGDGDEDVIVIGNTAGTVGLFENDGTGNFTNRSAGSGMPIMSEGSGFSAADYDGDGLIDVYLSSIGPGNRLMRNLGNFTFQDVTTAAGVTDGGVGKDSSWGDYNNDGWLDLYLANYSNSTNVITPGADAPNRLWRNNGDGTFTEVGAQLGVDDLGQGFGAVWSDYDRDGDIDLYLSNDNRPPGPYLPNQLWRNDGGVFVNVSAESGADVQLFSMGIAVGDFDRNGYTDYYFTNLPGGPKGCFPDNTLMLNHGDGTFIENGVAAGIQNPKTSWGALFWDFDNDTDLDLYVNNMWESNTFYVDFTGWPLIELGQFCGVQSTSNVSFCSSMADVDRDGDLDILLNDMDINVQLFLNNEGTLRNWIRFRMLGPYPNRYAIGGNVSLTNGGLEQFQEVYASGHGFLGQNEYTLHFGLDDDSVAEQIVARWPGGSPTRTLTNYPANVEWTLYPPEELGDANSDGMILFDDFPTLLACYQNPFVAGCEIMDFNGDGTVTDFDRDRFIIKYDGELADCDDNGITDLVDILDDPSRDGNGDGVLDNCVQDLCFADCTPDNGDGTYGNGVVNIDDLFAVLNNFGGGAGPCDVAPDNGDGTAGNGIVNIDDLFAVLNSFGDCP